VAARAESPGALHSATGWQCSGVLPPHGCAGLCLRPAGEGLSTALLEGSLEKLTERTPATSGQFEVCQLTIKKCRGRRALNCDRVTTSDPTSPDAIQGGC